MSGAGRAELGPKKTRKAEQQLDLGPPGPGLASMLASPLPDIGPPGLDPTRTFAATTEADTPSPYYPSTLPSPYTNANTRAMATRG